MLKIDTNGNISLTRGDSGELTLSVTTPEGTPYDFSNDTVEFGVKRSALCNGEALLHKTVVDGKLTFTPNDTAQMEFGDYVYGVKITQVETENVYTVLTGRFTLGYNVL